MRNFGQALVTGQPPGVMLDLARASRSIWADWAHQRWQKVGYPFDHLVPSLATALGSSGDRPAALSELMGIILNDAVQMDGVLVLGHVLQLEDIALPQLEFGNRPVWHA